MGPLSRPNNGSGHWSQSPFGSFQSAARPTANRSCIARDRLPQWIGWFCSTTTNPSEPSRNFFGTSHRFDFVNNASCMLFAGRTSSGGTPRRVGMDHATGWLGGTGLARRDGLDFCKSNGCGYGFLCDAIGCFRDSDFRFAKRELRSRAFP